MRYSEKEITLGSWNIRLAYDDKTVTINSGYNLNGERKLELPATLLDRQVVSIGPYAFSSCGEGLETVILPDAITEIKTCAFSGRESLRYVKLPAGLKRLGDFAFSNCKHLCDVDLPEGLETLGGHAFANTGLATVRIPASLRHIGENPFYNCDGLTGLTVSPAHTYLKDIDGVLFTTDMRLLVYPIGRNESGYWVPEGTASIGKAAFASCSQLAYVNLPDSLIWIDTGAFADTGLTYIRMSRRLTSIGSEAFCGCYKLIGMSLPDTLVHIGYRAFDGCGVIGRLLIPGSVTRIEDHAFRGCRTMVISGSYGEKYCSDCAKFINYMYAENLCWEKKSLY